MSSLDDAELGFLKRHGVTLYLDVGANRGQTGQRLRKGGYAGRICSFEPLETPFAALKAEADKDPLWDVFHHACGEVEGPTKIGVSANFFSSSILEASDQLVGIHAPVAYTHYQDTTVRRLDSLLPGLAKDTDVIYLKVDVQGFERYVVAGASGVLNRLTAIRLEVAISEMYVGEMTLAQTIITMEGLGFRLIEVDAAWRHPVTQETLHVDLILRRL